MERNDQNGFHGKEPANKKTQKKWSFWQRYVVVNFMATSKIIAPKSIPHVQHNYFFLIQPIMVLVCDVNV